MKGFSKPEVKRSLLEASRSLQMLPNPVDGERISIEIGNAIDYICKKYLPRRVCGTYTFKTLMSWPVTTSTETVKIADNIFVVKAQLCGLPACGRPCVGYHYHLGLTIIGPEVPKLRDLLTLYFFHKGFSANDKIPHGFLTQFDVFVSKLKCSHNWQLNFNGNCGDSPFFNSYFNCDKYFGVFDGAHIMNPAEF